MAQRTPLYQKHVDAGAKIVDFAGWDMPLHYGSQIAEHRQVRDHAGVFDVSHMNVVDLDGSDAEAFLRHVLCGDVAKLQPGTALYSLLLNDEGGVIDDLIVYRREQGWRLVANCGTRAKVLAWLRKQGAGKQLELRERGDLAILAVHGPDAIAAVSALLPARQAERMQALDAFGFTETDGIFVARTGYTGEQGVELIMPGDAAAALWDKLLSAGIPPIGLGARDTLRLEAGMNLYGHDMDETTSPLSANLAWTIAWEPAERDFIGRAAVTRHGALLAEGRLPVLTGLVLESRGVLREGQKVTTDRGDGIITSGSFAPTLNLSIALARVPVHSTECTVDLRGTPTPVRLVKPRFVRFGKKVYD
ncbi:MAG: glycine cleavage system aminomethyltransferase GcvT [Gammaproteobacteria bacterium]